MFWKKKIPSLNSRDMALEKAKQAMANKRDEIGDEALDKIRDAILKRDKGALQSAKNIILKADQDKVRDNLNLWLRE